MTDQTDIVARDRHRRAALRLALSAQTVSPRSILLFDAIGGVGLALLGHWGLGLYAAFGLMAFDLVFQRWCRGARARIDVDDPGRTLNLFGCGLLARHVVLLSGSVAALAMTGAVSEAVYLAITAATVLLLAGVQGAFSRQVLIGAALPGALAMAVAAWRLAVMPGGAGLVVACLILILLAGVVIALTLRVRAAVAAAEAEKLALIDQLAEARDSAVADRAVAEAAREEARRADAAKSVFLATMSHEIRTPINGVLGMAQVLRRSSLSPAQAEQVETLIQSGEMLLALLNDVLDWSRIEAGGMELAPTPTDLPALLKQTVALWGPRAGDKGLALRLSLPPDLPRFVSVDPLRLRQVLFNLIGNAIKFTSAGSVELSARVDEREGGRLVLAVADTGVGVESAALERIFERFGQASADTAQKHGGTGLGLAISRRLSELMGGTLGVETTVGEGSVFSVDLPLTLADAPDEAAAAAEIAGADGGPSLSVLTVDDNPVNLKVVELLLEHAGHRVTCAGSAPEGLRIAAARPFDVILTDMHMPPYTGVDVLQALRSGEGPNKDAPVFVLTADALDHDRERFRALGFSGHVPKPISVEELLTTVASVGLKLVPVRA